MQYAYIHYKYTCANYEVIYIYNVMLYIYGMH